MNFIVTDEAIEKNEYYKMNTKKPMLIDLVILVRASHFLLFFRIIINSLAHFYLHYALYTTSTDMVIHSCLFAFFPFSPSIFTIVYLYGRRTHTIHSIFFFSCMEKLGFGIAISRINVASKESGIFEVDPLERELIQ